jgi:cytochrome c553
MSHRHPFGRQTHGANRYAGSQLRRASTGLGVHDRSGRRRSRQRRAGRGGGVISRATQRDHAIMKILSIAFALSVCLVAPGAHVAAGTSLTGADIAHGGNGHGAPPCVSCHGGHFQGQAAFRAPALAGLPAAFILSRLAHYAGPDGHNPSMRQVATALGLGEREAVAAYLSSLPHAEPQAR